MRSMSEAKPNTWIRVPGPARGSMTHWQRSADASPQSRCAWTRAHGLSMSRTRSAGRSVSGRSRGEQRAVDAVLGHQLGGLGGERLSLGRGDARRPPPWPAACVPGRAARAPLPREFTNGLLLSAIEYVIERSGGDDNFCASGALAAPYRGLRPGRRRDAAIHPGVTHAGPRAVTLGGMAVQMAPSILAADFARLADEAAAVAGVADWLHVDVMDNHFVPNLTIGLPVVEALLKHAGLPLDCHLMIEDPDRWAPAYAEAGARNVTIHAEAATAAGPDAADDQVGRRPGRARRSIPATPVEPYADLLPEIDMLLLMTVEPGFGGQPFLDLVLPKLRRARELVARHGARGLAAGGRRGERGDDRALRRGGRGRVRRRLGRVRRGRPGRGRAGAPRPGRARYRARVLAGMTRGGQPG